MTDQSTAERARLKRLERGRTSELGARKHTSKASLQGLLQLPLLEEIENCGGKARPGEIYERLAKRMGLPQEALETSRTSRNGKSYNVFEQQVRWARQTAVMQGLIANDARGIWELADPAYDRLFRARRGTTILIYSLDDGLAIWGHAEDAASAIEKGSLSLIMLSPPHPTISRKYGKMGVPEWLGWMRRLTALWKDLLADDGTIAVNLMDVFVPGTPAISPYIDRFVLSATDDVGLNLQGRQYWHSPTKLGNINWCAKHRIRPKNTVEQVLLFSKTAHPNWSVDRMPRSEYAKRSAAQAARDVRRGKEIRPSGYDINQNAFAPNERGPMPGNLIISGGASGSDTYSRRCREKGLEPHPARFPEELPRRIITLTTEPGQVVYDPMCGSNTTGKVASELGRKFIASDHMLSYLTSSALRFDGMPGYTSHFQL
ncbi:MAG: DNA methylase [Stutzerimonas stutzeri]|nr:MAG: DNA methylase [Stutzerimonas stutzeri]